MAGEKELSLFDAVMIAEGVEEPESEEQYYAAWQKLVDSGQAWQLQGWFGRQAQALIEAGLIQAKQ
jgi:hypothetical protein